MNNMTNLIRKIEGRLGTDILNLPPELSKEKWASVIELYTIPTFSRYYPNAIKVMVNTKLTDEEGYSWIDSNLPDSIKVLGLRDIDWTAFGIINGGTRTATGFGIYDTFSSNYGLEEIALLQMNADITSLYNSTIYPEFKYPNKVRFRTAAGTAAINFQYDAVPITLLVEHGLDLSTIEPTKMEIFEELAQSDIANWLYQKLKYFDNLETVFANIDIKIDVLKDEADKRVDIVNRMDEGHVSAANRNQPLIYTV